MKRNDVVITKNLSIGYSKKTSKKVIAKNLNLTFQEGKLIALIGVNGIGKSTLLRTLIGIQKPLEGDVFLMNRNIKEYSSKDLAQNLSVVLTEKLPPSNLTVYELIALGRQPYTNWVGKLTNEDEQKIDEAIRLTNSSEIISRKHFEISDGQLQKTLVARALAQDTPLIILDEPTTHLDLQHKISLLKLLKQLASETKKCILFSTHDIDLAIQISNEMVVMTASDVFQDTPSNLIEKGVFATLFQEENIAFDALNKKFVFG